MPLPVFPNLDDLDDFAKRTQFVDWVLDALRHLVEDEEYRELFVDDLHGDMRAAWNDADGTFDELPEAVAALHPRQVVLHGLAGAQLRFKLATVRYWAERFLGDGGNGFVLRRLLDSIDTLLDSLLAATGAGSSLKELKDAVRSSVND